MQAVQNTETARKRNRGRYGGRGRKAVPVAPATKPLTNEEREEKSKHYAVWAEKRREVIRLQKATTRAYLVYLETKKVVDALEEEIPGFTQVEEGKPGTTANNAVYTVFVRYKALYLSARAETNAYRKANSVWDSIDIEPFDFYSLRV